VVNNTIKELVAKRDEWNSQVTASLIGIDCNKRCGGEKKMSLKKVRWKKDDFGQSHDHKESISK
jgi:hypothetical protein